MVTIHVIGAGGTGSYFLKEFCRFAQGRKDISEVIIYDGDTVEEKNLSRQCFTVEDVGRNKALVMAEILNAAFDIPRCAGVSAFRKADCRYALYACTNRVRGQPCCEDGA